MYTHLIAAFVFATGVVAPDRTDYVSEASYALGSHARGAPQHTAASMAAAASHFLAALDDGQRSRATRPLTDAERRAWTNLPAQRGAGGVRLGDCSIDQVSAACTMLAELLSEQGFTKLRDIMLADDQLLRDGQPRRGFGTEEFAIVVFGTPSATEPWAVQVDGHHVGMNLAISGRNVCMSPSFIGTQPHAFSIGDRRVTPLAGERADALALAASFTEVQRRDAVSASRRLRLRVGPGHDHVIPGAQGISCATFSAEQRERLLSLIGRWINDLPAPSAGDRMAVIATEIDHMHFAWANHNGDISFAIQSPSLIIEYAGQDLGGDPLDHIHTIYRDPTNEYGLQIESKRPGTTPAESRSTSGGR